MLPAPEKFTSRVRKLGLGEIEVLPLARAAPVVEGGEQGAQREPR